MPFTWPRLSQGQFLLLATLTGISAGLWWPAAGGPADVIAKIFTNMLSLISLPLIFLSVVSTISGMHNLAEMKTLGKKVLFYTLLTTLLAATTALILFLIINPVAQGAVKPGVAGGATASLTGYHSFLMSIIPSNLVQAFSEGGNAISVVFFALLLSVSILSLPTEQKEFLHKLFSSLFAAMLTITYLIIYGMPLGVWAFMVLFVAHMKAHAASMTPLILYIACVLLANLVQGLVVLPTLLRAKGISPLATARGTYEALLCAFFSKSSKATLPLTLKTSQENLGISKKVASFSLPLCTTINMNGCAAFILITVLFVAGSHGMSFTPFELISWIFIATLVSLGNAGIPMGCYFLASAFLTSMNVPLHLMWLILPVYSLFDMVETTLNIWSDISVTAIVDKEVNS